MSTKNFGSCFDVLHTKLKFNNAHDTISSDNFFDISGHQYACFRCAEKSFQQVLQGWFTIWFIRPGSG
jgi:hypothetical protein